MYVQAWSMPDVLAVDRCLTGQMFHRRTRLGVSSELPAKRPPSRRLFQTPKWQVTRARRLQASKDLVDVHENSDHTAFLFFLPRSRISARSDLASSGLLLYACPTRGKHPARASFLRDGVVPLLASSPKGRKRYLLIENTRASDMCGPSALPTKTCGLLRRERQILPQKAPSVPTSSMLE